MDVMAFSDGLAAAVERVAPAVVRVEGRRRRASSGIWLGEGRVVAANHAVERDEDLRVSFGGDDGQPAELVGRDPATDLALLRLKGGEGPSLPDGADTRVGHLVLAVARPGRTARAALGIVSAQAEGWRNAAGARLDRYLEADLRLPPGFSGAAVVDVKGALVGLATSGLLPGAAMIVPARTLRAVAQTLETHGGIRRAYLGIGSHPVRLQGAARDAAGQDAGLLVYSVEPDGPAERGGVLLGDVLLALDGGPLGRMEELLSALREDRVGAESTLRVLRSGKVIDVRVTPGERR